jgi:ribose transport system ATP-binding protein
MHNTLAERIEIDPARVAADPLLRLSGVSKSFSGVQALAGVSVEFHSGEVHAILGENGAGKSTLMNIIAGVLRPDEGTIEFEGRAVPPLTPESSAALGIAVSYQHPAVLPDLSVYENVVAALPARVFAGGSRQEAVRRMLDDVGLAVPLSARADSLTVAQKHLLELAKALALAPKVLILDEPTASLDRDATDMLFERVERLKAHGAAIIYITHRLAELREIADRVSVLRDGRKRGEGRVADLSDAELLGMIVGRTLEYAFPPKAAAAGGDVNLAVRGLTGRRFKGVSFEARRGEILGIAGVEGNGQAELMRALAGLDAATGEVVLAGRPQATATLRTRAAYMPSDRHTEGVAKDLSVRENATFASLERFASAGIMNRGREIAEVSRVFGDLAVKTPGLEAKILSLSGGNQQKVVLSRALLSEPGLVVADEPTQGVDVGARAEIYRILREVSAAGTPVVVNSSDAAELAGLCDVVVVLSRGRVVETLRGEAITEANIVGAAVQAATHDHHVAESRREQPSVRQRLKHLAQTDNATVVPLAAVIVLLALYVFGQNANFLSSFNLSNIIILSTALGFIALGQTIALMTGGIDLSVGPLAGLLVVIASFFVNDGQPAATIALGFLLMFAAALVVGLVNGALIRFANFTPIAATLAMFIGLQGMSFVLRDGPGGYINFDVIDALTYKVGPLPLAFVVLVVVAVGLEVALRRTRAGWQLRAVGSHEESARRIGVRTNRTIILAYVACSLLTAVGAVMLMAQIGVGDPAQGVNYTLSSITAVVLGGTSLRGGRGTFIGTLLGALLLTEVLNATSFLGLSQTYQYAFQGLLILAAALIYSTARGRAEP